MSCRAVLSIGGNQAGATELLRGVASAAAQDGILRAVSALYSTPPWGGVSQDDFLNAILIVEHPGSPSDVLEWGFSREREAGRTREVRWGPRSLDVDVISAEIDGATVTSDLEELLLPHPRARDRAFVLVPWQEVDPLALLDGVSVDQHLARLDPSEVAAVRRLDDTLVPAGWTL